ncbi:MAG TPA: hypothetical protein VH814_10700 [Steroidobacteraceae bacterium]
MGSLRRDWLKRTALAALCSSAIVGSGAGLAAPVDAEADWSARSNAAGVFYKNTFDFGSRDEMIASNYGAPPLADHAQLETTNKLSGRGAIRINVLKDDGEATYAYRHSFDMPVGSNTKNTKKKVFYYQFEVYLPKYILDHRFATVGNEATAHKFAIIQEPDKSFNIGEVVITNHYFRGFVGGYRLQSSTGTAHQFVKQLGPGTNPCKPGSTDYLYQSGIDAGPQSESGKTDANDCNLFRRRFGPMHYTTSATTSYGTPLSAQGNPDAIAAVNAAPWAPDAWNVVEVYVNENEQTVRIWHAIRGNPPKLVVDETGTGDIGHRDGNYTGVQLLPRLEERLGDSTRQDTYAIYDELIASDQIIKFPGGFLPPDKSTIRPNPPTSVRAE